MPVTLPSTLPAHDGLSEQQILGFIADYLQDSALSSLSSPAALPGLLGWWEAADYAAGGADWVPRAGTLTKLTQSNASKRPAYVAGGVPNGMDCVQFAVDDFFTSDGAVSLPNAATVLAVVKATGTGLTTPALVVEHGTAAGQSWTCLWYPGGGAGYIGTTTSGATAYGQSPPVRTNRWQVLTTVISTASYARVNGHSGQGYAGNLNVMSDLSTSQTLHVGMRAGTSLPMTGCLAALVIVNRAITEPEAAALDRWAIQRWAIT